MNADRVNRWLTLGAKFGVLVGIFLLLVELEQNRELARAQIHQVRSDAWVANRFARADSEFVLPVLEKIYAAGFPANMHAMDTLSPVESRRIQELFAGFAGDYDNLIFQYRQGYLDESFYENRVMPSIRELAPWWQMYGIADKPFLQEVLDQITDSPK